MTTSENPQVAEGQREALAPLDLRSLFVAGVHFGHPSKRWNPRMEDFIFGKRSRAHIIDLSKTVDALKSAKEFIEDIVSKGGECLMVGTKAQAQAAIKDEAEKLKIDKGIQSIKPGDSSIDDNFSIQVAEKTIFTNLIEDIRKSLRYYMKTNPQAYFNKIYITGNETSLKTQF